MTALSLFTPINGSTITLGSHDQAGPHAKVYIGAEPRFSFETGQVVERLKRGNIACQENPDTATHYFLFVTDTFLKSMEQLLPLIRRLSDPELKQRLFPIIMDKSVSIFGPGDELKYVKYWEDAPADNEVEMIRQNIALLIRILRDTLMPPLDQLLRDDLALITGAIEKKEYLLEVGHFFFLPSVNAPVSRKNALDQLSSLFKNQSSVLLTGPKECGKTTLAIEYAKQSICPSGVFWLDAKNEQTLERSYEQLAAQLGITPDQVKRKLPFKKDFLLIYDNVTDRSLVPALFSGHILMVTPSLPDPDMVLENFTPEEANLYITEQLETSSTELSSVLEYNPAKLTQAIAYIKSSKISPQAYVDYYRNDKERLLQKQQAKTSTSAPTSSLPSNLDPSPKTLQKYFGLSLEQLLKEFTDQKIEIFISYNWSTTKEVDQIDTFFKSLGIELLRDIRETRSFESLREFMKKVILESDYTFSIINPNYLKSFNCLFEVITTLQDPYWQHRLFPLVLSGTDLSDEAIHSYTTHWKQEAERLRNAGGSPTEVGIAEEGAQKMGPFLQIVRGMQPESLDTQLSTQFQKTLAIMLARQEKLEKKGIYKQAIFHLPMGRNKDFIGREKELSLLETSLKNSHSGAITNTGMGGVGKSQLALEYAYRHENEYEMIYWIRSEQESTIKADLRMLGLEMGIAEDFLKDENIISTMKHALQKRKGWLLVFDNAEDPDLLRKVLPEGGHILITSRNPNWEKAVAVDVFSQEEALHYLQKISGLSGQEEEFNLLAEELGYLPLALTQAAAYIRRQQVDVSTYRTAFKEGGKQLLAQKEKGYPGSVGTAWLLSMEKIAQEDPNALKLLNICSYLVPDKIPEEFLEAWLKEKSRVAGLDFQDALRILESYSLIDQKVEEKEGSRKKWISIHRLIQTVTRDQCEPEEANQAITLGITVMKQQFKSEAHTQEESEAGEVQVQHARALIGHAEERKLLSEQVGNVASDIGTFLWRIGHLEEAKKYYEKSLKIKIVCLETETHIEIAVGYNGIGIVLMDQGNLAEAKELHEKALGIYRTCLKTENHISVAASYSYIGHVLKAQGHLKEAKELYEKALKIKIACLKTENHVDVADIYNNIGIVLMTQGRPEEAKELYEKALKIKIACLGKENHTSIAASYNNIGLVLKSQGKLEEAKELYEKALNIFIVCRGSGNNTSVATSYSNIGAVLTAQGKLDEAKELYEKALKIKIDCLKTENHTSVADSYSSIGVVLKAQGKLEEAKKCFEKASNIYIDCLGTNHTKTAGCYNYIGNVLWNQRDLEGAKEFYEKALNIRIACLKTENHVDVANCYLGIGNVLMAQGKLEEAKKNFEKTLEIRIICLKTENHTSVAGICNNMGAVLKAQGKLEEAKEYLEKALNIYIICLKTENHVDVANNYLGIGNVLMAQGKLEEAKKNFEKTLEIRIICLKTENHVDVANSYSDLGDVCVLLKQLKQAGEHYVKAKRIHQQFSGNKYGKFFDGKIKKCQE